MRRDDQAYALATNASATGSAVQIQGGEYIFMADGTAGGATIGLQVQLPDGTFATVTSLDSNTAVQSTTLPYAATPVRLPGGKVQVAITGGTGVSVSAYLVGLG